MVLWLILMVAYFNHTLEDIDSTVTLVTPGPCSFTQSTSCNSKSIWSFYFCSRINLQNYFGYFLQNYKSWNINRSASSDCQFKKNKWNLGCFQKVWTGIPMKFKCQNYDVDWRAGALKRGQFFEMSENKLFVEDAYDFLKLFQYKAGRILNWTIF